MAVRDGTLCASGFWRCFVVMICLVPARFVDVVDVVTVADDGNRRLSSLSSAAPDAVSSIRDHPFRRRSQY